MFRIRYEKIVIVLTLLVGIGSLLDARLAQAGSARTSIEPLSVFGVGTVIPGTGSILVRTKEGVGATLHTFGLVPGNVYTFWWAVFNNPKECATTLCTGADLSNPDVQAVVLSGAGQIAGDDGTADFGAFRAVGDTTGREPSVGTAMALENAQKAQVHLVVRNHGPVIPAMLSDQLSMFNGGCPPNTCMNVQAAPHQP